MVAMLTSSAMASSSSVNSGSEESFHPSVGSDLLDGHLCDDELNEIPELPMMGAAMESYHFESKLFGSSFLDETHHLATNIAVTAAAIDGAMGDFEFLSPSADLQKNSPQKVPILPVTKGKKRAPPQKKSGGKATKKRRVSKAKNAAGSKAINISTNRSLNLPPPVVSPGSSVTCPTLVDDPIAPMPNLPKCGGAVAKNMLLPKPCEPTSSGWPESSTDSSLEVDTTGPVNIDSDYIKMLTSDSGAAECAKAIVCSFGTDGRTRTNRQHLSKQERTQASRDRNREHARNTRRRKKVYVDELTRTLAALCQQRDAHRAELEEKAQREAEQREVRYSVLQEFLNLRGGNSTDRSRWNLILVPDFTLRLPVIHPTDQNNEFFVKEQTLTGAGQVMGDSSAFTLFLQSLGAGTDGSSVALRYYTNKSDFFMDGSNAVLEWNATTVGAKQMGAKGELEFHGNVRAKFDPESNKLLSLSMIFDTGIVLSKRTNLAPPS